MALSLGVDPLPYLRANDFEIRVMDEVIKRAGDLVIQRKADEMQALFGVVRNAVRAAFSRGK